MQEKFYSLSKGARAAIVILVWLLTVISLVGCLMAKEYAELPWLEILLTCVGMFFGVVAICLTIVNLSGKAKEGTEE